jgi:ATP-dependent RNA helicase DDX31/DBP7
MLDMGFEKEVKGCTEAIKEKIGDKFEKLSIVLAAATTGGRLTDLVQNIMNNYVQVGFETDKDALVQVPSSIQQLYSYVPTQYRIHYLLAFLFCKRNSKVIVFMTTCQCVNFFYELIKGVDWKDFALNPDIPAAKKESIK